MDTSQNFTMSAIKGLYWRITFLNLVLILSVAGTVYALVELAGMNPWHNILQPLYISTVIAYTQFTVTLWPVLRAPRWQAYLFTLLMGVLVTTVMVVSSWLLM